MSEANGAVLTRADVEKRRKDRTKVIEAFGGKVRITKVPISIALEAMGGELDEKAGAVLAVKIVGACCVDDELSPIFTEEALEHEDVLELTEVANQVMAFSGLADSESKKNN